MVLRAVLAALVLAAAPGATPGPSTTPPAVRTVPASIDASGATDVTEALNRFLAEVPDGAVIRLRAGADYRVEGTLELRGRADLVLDGRGATIFATTPGARNRSHLSIDESSGIVVRDLVIVGAHPDGGTEDRAWRTDKAFQHGIRIRGASGVELDGVTVTDAFGDLVYVGWSEDRTWSEDVWIHDSVLARNGRQGIAVTAARNVVIERNVIADTRRATIDLEPDTPAFGAVNVHIIDNVIGPGKLRFIAAHGGGDVSEVVIARNELRGRDLAVDIQPPEGARRSSFWVVDNRSDVEAGSTPLRFTRLDGVVVRGNAQPVDDRRPAITAVDVCGLDVDGNDFPGAAGVVSRTGDPCGADVPAAVPSPPDLAGRADDAPQEVPEAAAGTSDEPGAAEPPPDPTEDEDAERPVSIRGRWGLGLLAGLTGLAVLLLRRRRRRRQRRATITDRRSSDR